MILQEGQVTRDTYEVDNLGSDKPIPAEIGQEIVDYCEDYASWQPNRRYIKDGKEYSQTDEEQILQCIIEKRKNYFRFGDWK